jgi:hypothetical protein
MSSPLTPGEIQSGSASRGSKIHATQADNSLSRSHLEEDISRLQSAVHAFSTTLHYNIGDLIVENNVVYRCTTNVDDPGTFNGYAIFLRNRG